jgi:hypothetical protein
MNSRISLAILLTLVLQPVPIIIGLNQASLYRSSQDSVAERAVSEEIPNPARMSILTNLSSQGVNVYAKESKEPAPMGIVDYGIGPDGPYEYATNGSVGVVTITSLSTRNSRHSTSMTFQLNVNLVFAINDRQYVYWIQDVAYVDTSFQLISFLDNVWNSSASAANMIASGISGNGEVALSKSGSYYYDVADESLQGNNIHLRYPATITLNVTSGLSSSGEPQVSFAYNDGYGLITYDTVTFTTAHGFTSLIGFEVNGFSYNPVGLFYDSELILGGPGGGSQTTDLQSDIQLQLEYWNGHNYEMIANAYNFGSDTAEGIGNVLSQFSHFPESGAIIAEIQPGAGQLGELYDQSQIGIIDVTSPLASGILYVTSAFDPTANAWQCPFVNGEVTVVLYPGYYSLQLHYQTGAIYDQGNFTVNAGQNLSLQAPFNVFTHNVAVISIVADKTVIGEGFSDNVTVNIANNGEYAETFTVTVYANTTVIGTRDISNLNATSQMTLTFTWNTTGLVEGNYTISAYAEPVSSETDTEDNNFTISKVTLSIPGDINGDGKVDILDISTAARAYGSTLGEQRFEPNADVSNDGIVNILDLSLIARQYGKTS